MDTGTPSEVSQNVKSLSAKRVSAQELAVDSGYGNALFDIDAELAAPAHDVLVVLLTRGSAPALRVRLQRGECAESVKVSTPEGHRRCTRVLLPYLGEDGRSFVVRDDAGRGVVEAHQVTGEGGGLVGGEGVRVRRSRGVR